MDSYKISNRLDTNQINMVKNGLSISFYILLFTILWIVIGFIAFITSIVCFFRTGTTLEKIIGLLLAIFFGPFYFVFFALNGNYCG